MRQAEELLKALGQRSDGYSPDVVIEAAANLLLNGLKARYLHAGDALAHLGDMLPRMQTSLRDKHYSGNGIRRTVIEVPNLGRLEPWT